MELKIKIAELAQSIHEEVIGIRRHIHAHPELSFEEVETGKYIAQQLSLIGIEYQLGMAGNGVVGLIKGKNPEVKTVALRADFDALPILEKNDVPYKSKNEGVMHACGHDVHTACLLGAAKILFAIKDYFEGTIKLIFQPGEEQLPGGASIMIKEGVLKNPEPRSIFGQHVHPPLEAGKVGFRAGKYMASADEIILRIVGKGGHGALPQDCIDPIVMTAQILTALQTITSRSCDPTTPSVLTFGKIHSEGGNFNVIPNAVKIWGTFRTMDETWRSQAHQKIEAMATHIAESFGGHCEVEINRGYPFLSNDEQLTSKSMEWAADYLGSDHVVALPIRMTAEDFSYFSQEMPACFYRLGVGNIEKGITSSVHTDTFDIDEKALLTGSGLMAWLTICELKE